MSKLFLQIPKPCHEDWSKMTPLEKGRFCASCQKTVYDFTRASDSEIASYAERTDMCGRFLPSQLNRELVVPTEKSSVWSLAASGVLGMLSLASTQAQEKPRPQAALMVGDNLEEVEAVAPVSAERDSIARTSGAKIVFGVVSDLSGPLPGANVMVAETLSRVQTDIDGNYQIEVEPGQTLVYSFVGMAECQIKVGVSDKIDMKMRDGDVQGQVIVTGGGMYFKRPNFVKRTYYRIRNWFL